MFRDNKSRNIIYIYSKKERKDTALKLRIHWDRDLQEYILCKSSIFGYLHFSLEKVKDMLKILNEENKEVKDGIQRS